MTLRVGNPPNYDVDAVSEVTGLLCEDESRAVQSGKEEADINTIVRRFGVTGHLPVVPMPPTFQDFGDYVFDYRTAQDMLLAAQKSFNALPAEVRGRFSNDPQEFLEFAENPANLEELRKMGLAVPKAAEPPVVAVAEEAQPTK